MHLKILAQWLADRLVIGHSTRTAALLRVVGALLTGASYRLPTLAAASTGQRT